MGLVPWFPLSVNPSELESSMSSVHIDQKSYEMPPKEQLVLQGWLLISANPLNK